MIIDLKQKFFNDLAKEFVISHLNDKIKFEVVETDKAGSKFKEAVKKEKNGTFLNDSEYIIRFAEPVAEVAVDDEKDEEDNSEEVDNTEDVEKEENTEKDGKEVNTDNTEKETNAEEKEEDNTDTEEKEDNTEDTEKDKEKDNTAEDNTDADEDKDKKKDKKDVVSESIKV